MERSRAESSEEMRDLIDGIHSPTNTPITIFEGVIPSYCAKWHISSRDQFDAHSFLHSGEMFDAMMSEILGL